MECESCGLPNWAVSSLGKKICLDTKGTKFKRASRKTVWVCSRNCDLCARAVAAMGTSTHRWPMTLAQFASLPKDTGLHVPKAPLDGQTVKSTDDNSQCLQGSAEPLNEKVDLPHQKQVKARRKGGRPKIGDRKTPAEYQRAYRERHRVSESLMQAAAE